MYDPADLSPEMARPLGLSAPTPRLERDVLRPVDHRREIGRSAFVGVKPRNQRAMRSTDGLLGSTRFKAKDLIGLLLTHFAHARRRALPRRRIELHVLTPSGRPAVEILRD